MKQRIFNLVILDESGSMGSIEKQAVDGVNETIQTIRKAQEKHPEQEHYISVVTFNDDSRTVYDCVAANEVKEFGSSDYNPDCCTALFDAMGFSLNALKSKVAENDKVLVTIITDGMENASKEFSNETISTLVDSLKARGWVFAYIGANQDVMKVAASISITNTMCFHSTWEGTAAMNSRVRRSRERMYDRMAEDDFNPVEANNTFFEEE